MSVEPNNHEHLYEVPIEQLGLSDEAIRVLKKRAVMTVGDCIDFYNRDRVKGALILIMPPFGSVMRNDVEQKVKEQGYWKYVNDDDDPNE